MGLKSPKTYRSHLNYLIEKGYVIDDGDKYILPRVENVYFMIPLETLQYINDNCREHIIKIYVYLGQRYKYGLEQGRHYEFTSEEIGEHIGLTVRNNKRGYQIINNALALLENSGLIEYVEYYDGNMAKKKIMNFSLEVKGKKS